MYLVFYGLIFLEFDAAKLSLREHLCQINDAFLDEIPQLMYKMNSDDDKPYDIGPKGKKRALPADQHLVNGQDSDGCSCCA